MRTEVKASVATLNPDLGYGDIYVAFENHVFRWESESAEKSGYFLCSIDAKNLPVGLISWYDRAYLSTRRGGLRRLQGRKVTTISGVPGAVYSVIANNHLFLANLSSNTYNHPSRVAWSDLYNPEDFEIRDDSEADVFDLEPNDGEITGLSYQRGRVIIYTRNSIWLGAYLNGEFRFEPIYADRGNVLHGAVVSVNELDYFISHDGIYALDGTQIFNIGNQVFDVVRHLLDDPHNRQMFTSVDRSENMIYWRFSSHGRFVEGDIKASSWTFGYNYLTGQWSNIGPDERIFGFLRPKLMPKRYQVINQYNDPINTYDGTINGDWQFTPQEHSNLGFSATRGFSGYKRIDLLQGMRLVSNWLDLGTLSTHKEIDKITLVVRYDCPNTGDMLYNTSFAIQTTNNIEEGVTTAGMENINTLKIPGTSDWTLFFRPANYGRYVRVVFDSTNTDDGFIEQILEMSVQFRTNQNEQTER